MKAVLQILIPTFNRGNIFEKNLRTIGDEIVKYGLVNDVAILVSNNCSTDDTKERIQRFECEARVDFKSLNQANNIGLEGNVVEVLKNDFAGHPDFQFCAADLTDPASVADLPLEDVDLLYHLAAAGVKAATRQWPLCVRVNVMGTATLMQALIQRVGQGQSVPRIVYTKTYYEDHLGAIPAFQENPYVVSKVAATRWVEALSAVYPQSITIAKVFQVYGPGDDPNNVLSYAARTLKAGEKAAFGSGQSLRDWIYIDDFIEGLIACGADHGVGLHQFDLGSGERHSIREMVELIAELTGADNEQLSFDPSRDRGDTEIEDWAKDLPPEWASKCAIASGLSEFINN